MLETIVLQLNGFLQRFGNYKMTLLNIMDLNVKILIFTCIDD